MKRNTFIQYAMITVSCAVYAFGFDWCYDANHISVGLLPVYVGAITVLMIVMCEKLNRITV